MIYKLSLCFIITILIILVLSSCSLNIKDINPKVTSNIQSIYTEADKAVDLRLTQYLKEIDLKKNSDFIDLTNEDKEFLINVAYKAAEDYFKGSFVEDNSLFLEKFNNINREVFVYFRTDGKKRCSANVLEKNLSKAVYVSAFNAANDKSLGGIVKTDLEDLNVEIFIIGDKRKLDNNYEKGIHGITVQKDNKNLTYCNNIAAEGNYNIEDLLKKICIEIGLPENSYNDNNTEVYYFPTIHFGTTAYSDGLVSFYRCSLVNFNPENSIEKIKQSLKACEDWMKNNLNDEGYFNYLYYPSNGNYSSSNNMIRQLMSSRWLAEKSNSDYELMAPHKKNLDYVFKFWYKEDKNLGYIFYDQKSKLGAIAMAIRAIVFSPYFEDYKDKAEKLANTIISLQHINGSFSAWYIEPEYESDEDHLLRFYSGEAILSLLEFYNKTNDSRYLESAKSAQDYYINEYVDNLDKNYYPALVPWQTMSLYHLYLLTGEEKYVDAMFVLNDELIKMQNTDGKPYADFLGRFYDPKRPEYGVPASSSTAIYVEGLCYAYEIAKIVKDTERMFEYKKAIILGAHSLMNLQFTGPDMYYLGHPERVEGAIKSSESNNSIRVDNTQHTIDAFNKIINLFGEQG
jgi:AMMECR1 domain-containing protein